MPYFPQTTIVKSTTGRNRAAAHVPLQSIVQNAISMARVIGKPPPSGVAIIVISVDATSLWKASSTRADVWVNVWGGARYASKVKLWASWFCMDGGDEQSTAYEVRPPRRLVAKATRVVAEAAEARYKQDDQLVGPFIINESARELWIVRQRFRVEKEDKISSYEDIIRDFRQNHQLIQGTLMEHVVGMKPVDNYRLMVQFKTTLDRLTLASVSKQINHYEAQNVLTNDMMSGGVSRSKWGYAAVKARALLPNPDRSHATEIFWGASLGVSEYELRVTIASFGRYLTLAEEPSFYMEPTYVHYVRATYENPQSAGLAAGQFLKVKTGVLQCTTGDSTQDALIRDRINSMLLDVVPDSSQVRLPHRLQYAAKFLGAKEAMAKLHDEHLKTKRVHEPAMDTQEKMMQWDTEDPLLQPKRAKTEAQDARLRMDTRRPTASTASDLKIKTSASKPQLAAPAHKPTVKPKPPTPARRGVPKPARK